MVYLLIVVALFFGERTIKKHIEEKKVLGREEEILNGNIIINKTHNSGAMLNLLDKKPKLVLAVSGAMVGAVLVVFSKVLLKNNNKILKLGMALMLSGALSNLSDRVEKGYVVDYFSFKWLKKVVFNLADIFIFIGGIMILLGQESDS